MACDNKIAEERCRFPVRTEHVEVQTQCKGSDGSKDEPGVCVGWVEPFDLAQGRPFDYTQDWPRETHRSFGTTRSPQHDGYRRVAPPPILQFVEIGVFVIVFTVHLADTV